MDIELGAEASAAADVLTSSMGSVLEREDASGDGHPARVDDAALLTATPTAPTDTMPSSSSDAAGNVNCLIKKSTEDPISSTSDVIETRLVGNTVEKSNLDSDSDFFGSDPNLSKMPTERITENVDDLVSDLETLLGESSSDYILPMTKSISDDNDNESTGSAKAIVEQVLTNVKAIKEVDAQASALNSQCEKKEISDEQDSHKSSADEISKTSTIMEVPEDMVDDKNCSPKESETQNVSESEKTDELNARNSLATTVNETTNSQTLPADNATYVEPEACSSNVDIPENVDSQNIPDVLQSNNEITADVVTCNFEQTSERTAVSNPVEMLNAQDIFSSEAKPSEESTVENRSNQDTVNKDKEMQPAIIVNSEIKELAGSIHSEELHENIPSLEEKISNETTDVAENIEENTNTPDPKVEYSDDEYKANTPIESTEKNNDKIVIAPDVSITKTIEPDEADHEVENTSSANFVELSAIPGDLKDHEENSHPKTNTEEENTSKCIDPDKQEKHDSSVENTSTINSAELLVASCEETDHEKNHSTEENTSAIDCEHPTEAKENNSVMENISSVEEKDDGQETFPVEIASTTEFIEPTALPSPGADAEQSTTVIPEISDTTNKVSENTDLNKDTVSESTTVSENLQSENVIVNTAETLKENEGSVKHDTTLPPSEAELVQTVTLVEMDTTDILNLDDKRDDINTVPEPQENPTLLEMDNMNTEENCGTDNPNTLDPKSDVSTSDQNIVELEKQPVEISSDNSALVSRDMDNLQKSDIGAGDQMDISVDENIEDTKQDTDAESCKSSDICVELGAKNTNIDIPDSTDESNVLIKNSKDLNEQSEIDTSIGDNVNEKVDVQSITHPANVDANLETKHESKKLLDDSLQTDVESAPELTFSGTVCNEEKATKKLQVVERNEPASKGELDTIHAVHKCCTDENIALKETTEKLLEKDCTDNPSNDVCNIEVDDSTSSDVEVLPVPLDSIKSDELNSNPEEGNSVEITSRNIVDEEPDQSGPDYVNKIVLNLGKDNTKIEEQDSEKFRSSETENVLSIQSDVESTEISCIIINEDNSEINRCSENLDSMETDQQIDETNTIQSDIEERGEIISNCIKEGDIEIANPCPEKVESMEIEDQTKEVLPEQLDDNKENSLPLTKPDLTESADRLFVEDTDNTLSIGENENVHPEAEESIVKESCRAPVTDISSSSTDDQLQNNANLSAEVLDAPTVNIDEDDNDKNDSDNEEFEMVSVEVNNETTPLVEDIQTDTEMQVSNQDDNKTLADNEKSPAEVNSNEVEVEQTLETSKVSPDSPHINNEDSISVVESSEISKEILSVSLDNHNADPSIKGVDNIVTMSEESVDDVNNSDLSKKPNEIIIPEIIENCESDNVPEKERILETISEKSDDHNENSPDVSLIQNKEDCMDQSMEASPTDLEQQLISISKDAQGNIENEKESDIEQKIALEPLESPVELTENETIIQKKECQGAATFVNNVEEISVTKVHIEKTINICQSPDAIVNAVEVVASINENSIDIDNADITVSKNSVEEQMDVETSTIEKVSSGSPEKTELSSKEIYPSSESDISVLSTEDPKKEESSNLEVDVKFESGETSSSSTPANLNVLENEEMDISLECEAQKSETENVLIESKSDIMSRETVESEELLMEEKHVAPNLVEVAEFISVSVEEGTRSDAGPKEQDIEKSRNEAANSQINTETFANNSGIEKVEAIAKLENVIDEDATMSELASEVETNVMGDEPSNSEGTVVELNSPKDVTEHDTMESIDAKEEMSKNVESKENISASEQDNGKDEMEEEQSLATEGFGEVSPEISNEKSDDIENTSDFVTDLSPAKDEVVEVVLNQAISEEIVQSREEKSPLADEQNSKEDGNSVVIDEESKEEEELIETDEKESVELEKCAITDKMETDHDEDSSVSEEKESMEMKKFAVTDEKESKQEETSALTDEKESKQKEKSAVTDEKESKQEEKSAVLDEMESKEVEETSLIEDKESKGEEKSAVPDKMKSEEVEKITLIEDKESELEEKSTATDEESKEETKSAIIEDKESNLEDKFTATDDNESKKEGESVVTNEKTEIEKITTSVSNPSSSGQDTSNEMGDIDSQSATNNDNNKREIKNDEKSASLFVNAEAQIPNSVVLEDESNTNPIQLAETAVSDEKISDVMECDDNSAIIEAADSKIERSTVENSQGTDKAIVIYETNDAKSGVIGENLPTDRNKNNKQEVKVAENYINIQSSAISSVSCNSEPKTNAEDVTLNVDNAVSSTSDTDIAQMNETEVNIVSMPMEEPLQQERTTDEELVKAALEASFETDKNVEESSDYTEPPKECVVEDEALLKAAKDAAERNKQEEELIQAALESQNRQNDEKKIQQNSKEDKKAEAPKRKSARIATQVGKEVVQIKKGTKEEVEVKVDNAESYQKPLNIVVDTLPVIPAVVSEKKEAESTTTEDEVLVKDDAKQGEYSSKISQNQELKLTITKNRPEDSILKIFDPKDPAVIEISPSESENETDETPIPKLIIKQSQCSPKITSPLKITIKPVLKPEDVPTQKSSPKLIIKPVIRPDDEVKVVDEKHHSPKITIKPIPKPGEECERSHSPKITIKPLLKPVEPSVSPKIKIKPIIKPEEVKDEVVDEEKERIVLKININPKDAKNIDESEKLGKIKVKLSKEGRRAHIVNEDILEDIPTENINEKQAGKRLQTVELDRPPKRQCVSAVEKPVLRRAQATGEKKENQKTPENPVGVKRKQPEDDAGESSKPVLAEVDKPLTKRQQMEKAIKKSGDYEKPLTKRQLAALENATQSKPLSKRQQALEVKNNLKRLSGGGTSETKNKKAKLDLPTENIPIINLDSDSDSQKAFEVSEAAIVPVEEVTILPITIETIIPAPKKRGRPRKLKVTQEVAEDPLALSAVPPSPLPPVADNPALDRPASSSSREVSSGRPKRSCTGVSVTATLGIKPRKPRGGGRGRGANTRGGAGGVRGGKVEKPVKNARITESKLKLIREAAITARISESLANQDIVGAGESEDPIIIIDDSSEDKSKEAFLLSGSSVKEEVAVERQQPINASTTRRRKSGRFRPHDGTVDKLRTSEVKSEEAVETAEFNEIRGEAEEKCEEPETKFETHEVKSGEREAKWEEPELKCEEQQVKCDEHEAKCEELEAKSEEAEVKSSDVVMFEEETRMSADNSRAPTPTKQTATDAPEAIVEESQSSVQSTATTESTKIRKGTRTEVFQETEGITLPEQLSEYYWAGDGPFMLQEQVAQYLGIKSFKRRYPGIKRRTLDMQERDYIRESGLASEHLCDLGLTAVSTADILDIMYSDFQVKYEEYCKYQRDKQSKDIMNKQKALSLLASSQEKNRFDIMQQAIESAAQWNANFNKTRKEERKACMDLQTFTINYPKSACKQIPKAKVGSYPIALVPGQYTDYYKTYTPTELNNLPLNTMLYHPINLPHEDDSNSDSESGSDSSSSGSGSSDSDSSDEDCALCSSHGATTPAKKTAV